MYLWLYPIGRHFSLTVRPITIVSPRLAFVVLSKTARGASITACRSQWLCGHYIMFLKALCRSALARMNLWTASVRDCFAHVRIVANTPCVASAPCWSRRAKNLLTLPFPCCKAKARTNAFFHVSPRLAVMSCYCPFLLLASTIFFTTSSSGSICRRKRVSPNTLSCSPSNSCWSIEPMTLSMSVISCFQSSAGKLLGTSITYLSFSNLTMA